MKTTQRRIILTNLLIFLTVFLLNAQEWEWEWANSSTNNGNSSSTQAIHCDLLNNIYCHTSYDSVIYFSDTSFHHPDQLSTNANCAISKYDIRGNLINVLDLYTLPGSHIFDLKIITDTALNLYISAVFRKEIFINDTSFTSSIPYSWQTDVLVAKLSPDYNIIWAKLISSPCSDHVYGMLMSEDDHIYMSCRHISNAVPMQVTFLNQDTSSHFLFTMNSIIKFDLDGNMKWHKELITESSGTGSRELFVDENEMIYLLGYGHDNFSIDGDTVYFPNDPITSSLRYLTKFNQDGEFLQGFFINWDIWIWDIKVVQNNDYIISGMIQDTAVIGNDTVIVPEGDYWGILGKFDDQLNPIWIQMLKGCGLPRFTINDGNIIFSGNAEGTVQLADTIIYLGSFKEVISGELDENGDLISLISTSCSNDLQASYYTTDNCGNPIIGGGFMGTVIFGQDTLSSVINGEYDGFIAKIKRLATATIEIGSDTTVCEEFTIFGPDGFQYYMLNDSISNQNSFTITETGSYKFACSNEDGCWFYDTINVVIDLAEEIDLGPDTSIRENDTIIFEISEDFNIYKWSDSTYNHNIEVIGMEYGIGNHHIWVEAIKGVCVKYDTILLEVKSEFGIDENSKKSINIFPNPFEDEITIEVKPNYKSFEIYNLNGIKLFSKIPDKSSEIEQIKLENLNNGVYILKIRTEEQEITMKIIKI